MKQVLSRTALVAATVMLAACGGGGGGGGSLPDSISNKIVAPSGTVQVAPGRGVTATAKSEALRSAVVAMNWSLERREGTGGEPPVIANADCSAGSLKFENSVGKGQCSATVLVPANATPGLWRVGNTAMNEKGEIFNAAFELRVIDPPYTGFTLYVPQVPMVYSLGQVATVHSTVSTPTQLGAAPLVTYRWRQTAGPTQVGLTGSDTRSIAFAPSVPGEYVFEVSADVTISGVRETQTKTVVVVVRDPIADRFILSAGEAKVVHPGAPVLLIGTLYGNEALFLPSVSFEWRQLSGPSVTLANRNSMTASFIPNTVGEYVFELRASTTHLGTTFSEVAQTVVLVVAPAEALPEDPAPDLTGFTVTTSPVPVTAVRGATVTIPSTVAFPAGATVTNVLRQWTQTGGPAAQIANASAETMSFVPAMAGQYSFTMTVTASINGVEQTRSNTAVIVVEDPFVGTPVVSAGDAQAIDSSTGTPVVLAGSVTYPPGVVPDVPPTYSWSQVGGPGSVVYNSNTLTASVVLQDPGTYTYQLTVTGTVSGTPFTGTATTAVLVRTPAP